MSRDTPSFEYRQSTRFIRWQGFTIAQFTIAIALLSALSISMLGASSILVLKESFQSTRSHGLALSLSMLSLTLVVLLCVLATVSRTLDFRLTARKVRGKPNLTIFGLNKDQFGNLSWFFFWTALILFFVGGGLFVASMGLLLVPKLLCSI